MSGALAGGERSTSNMQRAAVTGNGRVSCGVLSILMEKRMINLLIIVLRAVAALANALIAVPELIRQFID